MNNILIKFLIFTVVIVQLCSSCLNNSSINKETSAIGGIYAACLKKDAWDSLFVRYDVSNIKDSLFKEALIQFENKPFNSYVLYFQNPEELIGISTDKYMVRYVYNPDFGGKVIDGFLLTDSEKNRILNRMQRLLMEFQCDEGKKQSLNEIQQRKE